MVHNFIVAAQFGIFVCKNVETVRAGGDNFFYPVIIQRLDVLVGHHLEKKFIAGTPCRIAGTHFFLTQDGKGDTHLIQNGGKGFCDFLRPLVKAPCATHPK